jgi:hypothetical protein
MQNYIEEARKILEKKSDCHGSLLDLYTLLVFVKGKDVNWKDVHDAWAVWKNNEMPDHKSLIPYEALTLEVQELDKEYADAIAKTAEELGL